MTDTNVPLVPLDTAQWQEPTLEFVGEVKVCEFRTTDDAKGRDGRTFTETRGLPRPGRTWHVEVDRLDAVYDLEDGTNAPVRVYMTVDLERLIDGVMSPVTRGDNKPTFTIDQWSKAGIRLMPDPTRVVGVRAEFTLARTKMFRGAAAKDVLYPTKILAKDFQFAGEVRHFQVKAKATPTNLDDYATASPTLESSGVDVAALVRSEGLDLADRTAVQAFIKSHPELPAEDKVALATGEFVEAV